MDGIELMASAMHAARVRLDVSASNLANVSSSGFRRRVSHVALEPGGLVAASSVDRAQGPLKRTGRNFDLAAVGERGFFVVDPGGAWHEIRSGSFERDGRGRWHDERGFVLLGRGGPLVASAGATLDSRGIVSENGAPTGRLALAPGGEIQSGFLEAANVDAVREMVDILAAQRAFESAQKALSAIDDVRAKDASDVARVKA